MNPQVKKIYDTLITDYPQLAVCSDTILEAFDAAVSCYESDGKIMVCGNGGSAADAEHIVGELMKGFMQRRELSAEERALFSPEIADTLQGSLPAISLVSQSGIITAYANDIDPDMIFAQQVYGYGKAGDLLLGISTSGNSKNVIKAFEVANGLNVNTLALTGEGGGKLAELATVAVQVPSTSTPKVQELHLPVYHAWCAMLEAHFFTEGVN